MDYINNFFTTLTSRIGELMPGVVGAILVFILGLLAAAGVRRLVLYMFKKTKLDERVNEKFKGEFKLDRFVARLAYFLVLIYILLLVLDMMGIQTVLDPLSNMLGQFTSYIPNFVGAILIGYAGYIIAKLASEATGFIAMTLQTFSEKAGLKGSLSLENIVKQLVFILIFIPVLIAALDTLKITAISGPATEMLNNFLMVVPQLLAAAVILAVFYIGGKFVIALLKDLLHSLGLDNLSNSLGVGEFVGEDTKLSDLVGNVAFFFLMFGGVIAAADKLNMPQFTAILNDVFDISGKVFFGVVILFLGNYLANLAKKAIIHSEQNEWLGSLVKFAVLFIFLAIGLSTMGIGEDIVNLAFGITVGAIGIAFAIAFGLGGKEAAGKYMEDFFKKVKGKK